MQTHLTHLRAIIYYSIIIRWRQAASGKHIYILYQTETFGLQAKVHFEIADGNIQLSFKHQWTPATHQHNQKMKLKKSKALLL